MGLAERDAGVIPIAGSNHLDVIVLGGKTGDNVDLSIRATGLPGFGVTADRQAAPIDKADLT